LAPTTENPIHHALEPPLTWILTEPAEDTGAFTVVVVVEVEGALVEVEAALVVVEVEGALVVVVEVGALVVVEVGALVVVEVEGALVDVEGALVEVEGALVVVVVDVGALVVVVVVVVDPFVGAGVAGTTGEELPVVVPLEAHWQPQSIYPLLAQSTSS